MTSENDEFKRMYRRVEWFKPADRAILEVLAPPKRLKLTPGNIAKNTGYSSAHVYARLNVLTQYRLLDVEGDGDPFYSITDLGVRVVDREIDVEELLEIDPEPVDEE